MNHFKLRFVLLTSAFSLASACVAGGLASGVRGIATRAPKGMKIDGDLSEFKNAFCTPVEYHNADSKNRAAQFFYMWDEEAFYAGLRTLDTKPANFADDNHLWEGDAVEWYFDTRRGDSFRGQDWGKGAVHCYWTGMKGTNVQARFCLRPGYLDSIPKIGVEVGSRRTASGLEVEFKLPWANFPNFKAAVNEVIALDAELCYSDGIGEFPNLSKINGKNDKPLATISDILSDPQFRTVIRTLEQRGGSASLEGGRLFRSFVYGSPLSVQQPASQAKIQLVEKVEDSYWKQCGPVMTPIRCDTAWSQKTRPMVTGTMALPSNQKDLIGKTEFRILDLEGAVLGKFEGTVETFNAEGGFLRAVAQWPAEIAVPGGHQLLGIVYDIHGRELARVAPRLVSVNMNPGY